MKSVIVLCLCVFLAVEAIPPGKAKALKKLLEKKSWWPGSSTEDDSSDSGGFFGGLFDSSSSERDIAAEIHAREAEYRQFFKEMDFEALANLYAPDAAYITPGGFVKTKEAIATEVWVPQEHDTDNNAILYFHSDYILEAGDYVIGYGEWNITKNPEVSGPAVDDAEGWFLTVYCEVDDEWLIEVDMINQKEEETSTSGTSNSSSSNNVKRLLERLLNKVSSGHSPVRGVQDRMRKRQLPVEN